MIFYIYLFFFVSISSYLYTKSKTVNSSFLFFTITFLLLFIPAALRYGIGTDYFSYVNIYNMINKNVHFNYLRFDLGFVYLCKLIFFLNLNVQWMFIIISFLTYLFLLISVKKEHFFLIIPFYFLSSYLQSYNIIRNALVITMGYFIYNQFKKKKYFLSILFIIFASLFHYSALFYLIIFIIANFIHLSKKQFRLLFIPIILLGFFAEIIVPFIINNIPIINFISLRYEHHLYNFNANRINLLIGCIPRLFIYFMFLISLKKEKKNISNLTLLIILLFTDVMYMFSYLILIRVIQMLYFVIAVILCDIHGTKSKYRKITIMMTICYFFLLFMNDLRRDKGMNAVPYKMIENYEWILNQNI